MAPMRIAPSLFPLFFLAFLAQDSRAAAAGPSPAAGKAMVVFFRPATGTSFLDGARHALFEIKDSRSDPLPIGIGGGGSKVAYKPEAERSTLRPTDRVDAR